jgi:glycosyltransferase involved in cell wall biosynthesis
MRVLMLVGPSTGGIGTHVAQLSAGLRERGVDVLVVTHPLTAGRFDLEPVRLCWPGSTGLIHALADLRALRRLVHDADVVHAHGHQAGLLATLAVLKTGPLSAPRLIVSQHNAVLAGSGRAFLKRLSQRWVARRADLVTGASSDLVKEARALGARSAELAEVPSPRVPDLLAQRPADTPERVRLRHTLLSSLGDSSPDLTDLEGVASFTAPLVVTVSRIAPQKNLPVLVEAANRLRQPCTWVVVGAGDPKLLAELRRQVSALGVPVHFVGSRDDVGQWLRAAEVFVLPSQWEARALVVQEAMAAGTPVVATDVGGLHDLLTGSGLLVPPGDPDAVAAAVDSILADDGLRKRLADGGRQVAKTLPDGSDTASRWLAWYSETSRMR